MNKGANKKSSGEIIVFHYHIKFSKMMFLNIHLGKKMKEYNSICSLLWQWNCNAFLFFLV